MTDKRRKLLTSKAYLATGIRLELFRKVQAFLDENGLTRRAFAERLGFTKGYVSKVLNGDADLRISKLVELGLAVGLVPVVTWLPVEEFVAADGRYTEARAGKETPDQSTAVTLQGMMQTLETAHGVPYQPHEYENTLITWPRSTTKPREHTPA